MGYQPGFDIPQYDFAKDLAYGHAGEEEFRQFLQSIGQGSFEVKSDRYRNGKMVIETMQNPRQRGWKPSGIAVTTADWWVYKHAVGAYQLFHVSRIRQYLDKEQDNLNLMDFAAHSDNPTKGYLLLPNDVVRLMNDAAYDPPTPRVVVRK